MTKQTRQWLAATAAWIKTQEIAIESCDLAMRHAQERISLSKAMIKLEKKQRDLMIKQIAEVKKELELNA